RGGRAWGGPAGVWPIRSIAPEGAGTPPICRSSGRRNLSLSSMRKLPGHWVSPFRTGCSRSPTRSSSETARVHHTARRCSKGMEKDDEALHALAVGGAAWRDRSLGGSGNRGGTRHHVRNKNRRGYLRPSD